MPHDARKESPRPRADAAPVFEAMEPRLMLDAADIVINEIMYHPGYGRLGDPDYVAEDLANEWIELANTGPDPVNLNNWRLNRGVDYTFPDVTLGGGDYLVVAADTAAFMAKYTEFTGTLVGGPTGWDGRLSNSGEDIELEDAGGNRIDIVSYADEGDWARRERGPEEDGHPTWYRGWVWVTGADGGGKSLELKNPALSNNNGQNWAESIADEGTPGAANSIASTDIAPMILDVEHYPLVPSSLDPITITARVVDELTTGLTVTLHWRIDGGPAEFTPEPMADDGLHGDGLAGDGTYGATIGPLATNLAIVEFYVEASDAGANTRTWPGPTDGAGAQGANAYFQVDNSFTPGEWNPNAQPIYRLVILQDELDAWLDQHDDGHPKNYSNAEMNATFLTIDGTGARLRYQVGVRNRGESTRGSHPHNYRVNIPTDNKWYDRSAVDFNTHRAYSQMAAAAIFQVSGLPAADGAPVLLLTNGLNGAGEGPPQDGSYFRISPYNSEFAGSHFPGDSGGNMYKGIWTASPDADLRYIDDDPDSYRMSYEKQTNAAQDDWTDLIELVRVLNTTPDDQYAAEVGRVVNVDEWLTYFAVNLLIANRENSLGGVGSREHYIGDDYSMYRGTQDPRFCLLVHDLDTVLGAGTSSPADSTPEGLFPTSAIPALDRFMKWPAFAQRYYQILKQQAETTFAPETINPLLDQVLGGFVPPATIQSMKDYAAARRAAILALIPPDLTVASGLSQSQGYDYTTEETVTLTGTTDAARTATVLVGGYEAAYSPWEGDWTTVGGTPFASQTLVADDHAATFHVPTDGEDALAWTALDYNDDEWLDEIAEGQAGLLVTEVSTGLARYVEIQNVSDHVIDTTDWAVLLNDPSLGSINDVLAVAWDLPASVTAGQVLYQTDDAGDAYWGATIPWDPEGPGWVMILDSGGTVMDFVAWGYTAPDIASLSIDYGGFTGITVGDGWGGGGADPGTAASGPPTVQFTAFNDHVRGADTHANATSYAGNGTDSGPLKDIATGDDTPVTLATPASGIHYGNNGADPAAGTDAYTVFDGYVDFSTATESSIEIAALDGDYYTHALTGLDTGPDVTYNFTGTAVRGDVDYTDRWTLVTLDDADAATPAHSTGLGVVVVSPTQVAIWTGYNSAATQGFVAAWTDIDPGADGDFSVISTQYTGATPGVGSGTADGSKGYGLAGIRLENVAPSGPLSFLKRTGNRDSDGAADFVRSATASKGVLNAGMTVPFGTITPVAMGIGFSTGPYDAYVGTDVADAMMDTSASLWTRIEFQAPDLSTYDALKLDIRYDDGFAAYLNGIKVAESNAPAGLAWDSAATGEHAGDTFEEIDLSAYLGDLNVGDNVLAIHGLNYGASDPDFLIQADLAATRGTPGAGLALNPGINRLIVQALDETGAEIERTTIDIWYDTASTTDVSGSLPAGTTTWTAAGGPYHVTGDLTVPSSATLVIEPGATVFFDAGRRMTVNGKLDARGAEYGHIRFTATPGAGDWTGLRFSGGSEASLIAYADIAYSNAGSESIEATGGAKVHLDHIVWDHHNAMYLDWHDSSIILTNSVLPVISGAEAVHFWGFPADGYALFDGNWLGGASGYNDVIDFTGGQRPGPIARFTNNVFAGGGDDCLDLDAADAYVAGNLFMNIHQDADRASKSFCVSTGTEYGDLSRVTVVGNIFYDVDHALLVKNGCFITAVNNTIVNVNKTYSGATTAVISFFEDRSGQWPGVGVILEGNIILGAENLWENRDDLSTTTVVTADRNVIYDVDNGTLPPGGVGNLIQDPRLWNTVDVTDPWTDFALRPGSPAIGAGFNGVDVGAMAGYLATIAGEPDATTWQTSATLTVGGPDIYGYKYRVRKDGAWLGDWSAETPLDWTVPQLPVSSITRSGSVATATVPGHGFSEGDVVVIEGAGSREYKGPFTISNVTPGTFDYNVSGSPGSPAGGTITCWKPQAAPVAPPIELAALAPGEYTVHVITRNSAGLWQSEADATASRTWTVDPAFTRLRINEVLADNETAVEAGGLYPDAIELYYDAAPGSPALDLEGYGLTDNRDVPGKFVFPTDAKIQPGKHLVLYADEDLGNPGTWLGFSVKADGDDVWLYEPGGVTVVDSVTFGIQLADRSIGRAGPDAAWALTDPTFGAANQAVRTGDARTLAINEWLADGDVLFVNDFVEIYNPDPLPVGLGGLYLSDNPGPRPDLYEVPALSFVEGGAMSVFVADDDPGQGADHVNFKVSPYQGLLGLFDSALACIDQVYYTPQTTDVSRGRTPDGADAYDFFRLPTPGVANPADPTGETTVVDLIGYTDQWHYEESGLDLAAAWRGTAYDTAAPGDGSLWQTGAAVLHIENDALPDEPGTGAPPPKNTLLADRGDGKPYNTYYFRITFDLGTVDPDDVTALNFTTLIDDGAVVYLNGEEVRRIAMADPWPTPVDFNSMASRSGECVFETFVIDTAELSPGLLTSGENLLAVEVHQGSTGSSDVVWTMKLTATVHTTSQEDPLAPLYDLLDDLRITEIMYDPQGGKDYEFLELANTGTEELVLAGVRLRDGIDFTFPEMTLPAGEYVVVARDVEDFQGRYPGVGVAGQWEGALDNDGERLILQLPDPYDAAVLRFDYDNDWYAPLTEGDGLSLVVLTPKAHRRTWDERGSWRPSAVTHGSPGADDPTPEYPVGAIVVGEVLAHQDQATGDWIELYNATSPGTPGINLAGWFLSDDSADPHKYEITESASGDKVLLPGEYIVFTETDHFGGAFALSEHGDDVWLSSASGAYVESAVFGASDNGVTLGRHTTSTGAVDFVPLSAPTAGYLNAYPKVGPVVISEVMYHPEDGQDEFIELANISGADVPLYESFDVPDYGIVEAPWKFTEGIKFAFPAGATLPAGGHLLVTRMDPAAFRTEFAIDPSVPIYGPFEDATALENDGETVELSKPGTPDHGTGFFSYVQVDSVRYSDGDEFGDPWPNEPDGNGPSLERVALGDYGNDVVNWTASPADGGSPGEDNSTAPPRVAEVVLNPHDDRTVRGVGEIDPSALGVKTVRITFNETVTFTPGDVTAEKVEFDEEGNEIDTVEILPENMTVAATAPDEMTITFADSWQQVVDTWVRITLAETITDTDSHALDGEPAANSSGLGYIYNADDLPSGNGAAGGDAVFYVGSLRADMHGFGPDTEEPNGTVDMWDINGFTQKYLVKNLDADFRGFGMEEEEPNGTVNSWDINGFTSRYSAAITSGAHLEDLPTASGGGMAPGAPSPLPLTDAAEIHLLAQTDDAGRLEVQAAPPATGPAEASALSATVLAASDDTPGDGFETVPTVDPAAPESSSWSPLETSLRAASDTPAAASALDADGGVLDLLAGPALVVSLVA